MIPKVKFIAEGGMYSEFLNSLIENDFYIFNIVPNDFGFTAVCYASDYLEISRIGKRFQSKLKIQNKIGLYFKFSKLINRKGLWIGVVLYITLSAIFSHFIWRIDVNIDDNNLKNNIYNSLYNNGVYTGAYYTKEKLEKAATYAMVENEVGQIFLNFYKGVLECEVYPKISKEEYISDTVDHEIVSNLSGIITDLRVYSGFSNVELGQSVSQGDILVNCSMIDEYNNLYYEKARAYIEALCEKTYSVYIPFEKENILYTGKEDKSVYVNFLDGRYQIKKSDKENWYESTEKSKIKSFSILGFRLPLTVETVTYYQMDRYKIKNDTLSANKLGKLQIQQMIWNDEKLKKEVDRQYDYLIDDEGIQINCFVKGYYEIT